MDMVALEKITVGQYYRMGETGVLPERPKTELIRGEIVMMSPIGDRHSIAVDRTTELFFQHLGSVVYVRGQSTQILGEWSAPEPDLNILARRSDYYATQHPRSQDIHLIIEVADSSLEIDRRVKVPLYFEAGVREVWIVNLRDDLLEVYRDAEMVRVAHRGETVAPLDFPNVELPVDAMLPPLLAKPRATRPARSRRRR